MGAKVTVLRPVALREVHRLLPCTAQIELEHTGARIVPHWVEVLSFFAHALMRAVGKDDLFFVCERFHQPRSVGISDAAATLTQDLRRVPATSSSPTT